MRPEHKRGLHFLGMLLGIVITTAYSVFILRNIYRQHALESASSTQAVVVIRQVNINGANVPLVQFRYEVGGKSYTGDVYRYGIDNSFSPDWIKDHRNGSKVRISYDPSEPSVAVVSPGLDSRDMTQVLVCLALLLGTLLVILDWLRGRLEDRPLGNILVAVKGSVTTYRLSWRSPLDVFFTWLMGACCVCAVGLHVAIKRGFQIPPQTSLALLAGAIVVAVLPTLAAAVKNYRGRNDVVIDMGERELRCLECPYGHKKGSKPFTGSLKGLSKVLRHGDTWVTKGVSQSHFFPRFVWNDERKVDLAGMTNREQVDKLVEELYELVMPKGLTASTEQALRDATRTPVDENGEKKAPEEENWTGRWMPAKKDKPKGDDPA